MKIWDLHCHLAGVAGRTPHERMSALIDYADRMQVERLIVFMGFPWSHDPSPDEFRRQNDQVLEALSHWTGRALGLAYINPKHVDASLKEMERCIEKGPLVGIKLWVALKCNHRNLDPIAAYAGKLKALFFQHTWLKTTGNMPGESTPSELVELARRYPKQSFVCGHTGGNWELGIRPVRDQKNILIGTGGYDPTAGIMEMAVRELGAERIIYGSDIGGRSFSSQLAKVLDAQVSTADKQRILSENLKRLLQPFL